MMTEAQIVKRKITLKRQAILLIRGEVTELKRRENLLNFKRSLESKITASFDPVLSRKLDCVIFLLEN